MAFILRPEFNFPNGYFRCLLPLETVDIEVKVKMMRGIHTFRRDRTSQIIKCNSWSTKLCPYPFLIQKMTYLELEGKLGLKPRPQPQTQPQPSTSAPPQNNNPMTRKAPGPKMSEQKKRRTRVPTKRRYKVRVIAQPIPTTPNANCSIEFNPNCTYPHSSHHLHPNAHGKVHSCIHTSNGIQYGNTKFAEVPYPSERPQAEENPSIDDSNLLSLEAIHNAPVRQDTPWPSIESAPENLFETRKDWPIPPTPAPTVKTEVPLQTAVIPHAMVMPKQVVEKCSCGPHCPMCIKEEEEGRKIGMVTGREISPKNHHPQNTQHPQSFEVHDRYSEQIRLRKEWDEKIEHLNAKYG